MITNELKNLIRPHLIETLADEYPAQEIEACFEEVYYSAPDGVQRVTINPPRNPDDIALQFNLYNGEFVELTSWEYIQTVGSTTPPDVIEVVRDENEKIACALKHYLARKYALFVDLEKVAENRVEVEPGIYRYDCSFQTIYLDTECYPVTRGNQRVDIENNKYYYNFSNRTANSTETDAYDYVATYEWKRNSIWE